MIWSESETAGAAKAYVTTLNRLDIQLQKTCVYTFIRAAYPEAVVAPILMKRITLTDGKLIKHGAHGNK